MRTKKIRTVAELLNDPRWIKKLAAMERKLMLIQSMRSGDAEAYSYYRGPYAEKRIRRYSGHWVTVVRPVRKHIL